MERILTNGKKMIVGALLLLAGMIAQSFSTKTLAQIPFLFMAMGLMCFVNALISKISGCNINLFLFLAIQLAAVEAGIVLTSYQIPGSTQELDSMTVALIWLACIAAAWILQIFVIRRSGAKKGVALAALAMFLSVVAALAAFVVPILLSILL